MFAAQHGVEAFFHELLARSCNRRKPRIERLCDFAVAPALAAFSGIRLEENASLCQLLRGVFATTDHHRQTLSLRCAQLNHAFLYGDLFPATNRPLLTVRGHRIEDSNQCH